MNRQASWWLVITRHAQETNRQPRGDLRPDHAKSDLPTYLCTACARQTSGGGRSKRHVPVASGRLGKPNNSSKVLRICWALKPNPDNPDRNLNPVTPTAWEFVRNFLGCNEELVWTNSQLCRSWCKVVEHCVLTYQVHDSGRRKQNTRKRVRNILGKLHITTKTPLV